MDDCQLLGEYLREQRLQKGLSLQDISLRTKIKMNYLQALEEGHYDQLPVDTYIKGFLGSYSEVLDVQYEKLIELYSAERPETPTQVLRSAPGGIEFASTKKISLRIIPVLLVLLILFSGLAAWWLWPQDESVVQTVIESVDQPVTIADETIVTTVVTKEVDAPVEKDSASAVPLDENVAAKQLPVSLDLQHNEKTTGQENRRPELGAASSTVLPAVLELRAVQPVVVSINIDGREPQTYSLQPGSLLRWRIRSSLQLQTDPVDAVRLHLNDLEVKPNANGQLFFPVSE